LTHYSRVGDVASKADSLLRHLDAMVNVALEEKAAGDERHVRIKERTTDYLLSAIRAHGCTLPDAELHAIWATDLELNAQGLGVWLDTLKD